MGLRLTPRDTTFYDQFALSAGLLLDGSRALTSILSSESVTRATAAGRLRELEQQLDESTHTILRRLGATFVVPFDRADIHTLAAALDDCMDLMSSTAELVEIYRLPELPKGVDKQVEILGRMAELTVRAMPSLVDLDGLGEYFIEINRLENEANHQHRRLLGILLDEDEPNVIRVIKAKAIVDELEKAANAFEAVADVLERIALKES